MKTKHIRALLKEAVTQGKYLYLQRPNRAFRLRVFSTRTLHGQTLLSVGYDKPLPLQSGDTFTIN